MSKNYAQRIDECTGHAFANETLNLGNGAHVVAHTRAKEDRNQRMKLRQSQIDINLDLPEGIKKYNGWFPVINDGSFKIAKDLNGIISLNSKIPQITPEQARSLVFLTRNVIIESGIDKYGGRTMTEVPYTEIVDSTTKDRIFNVCYEANRLGL
ncbi:MAG: hypothetical protein WC650_05050 [Candidatus Doudnabacteria bacterium]